MRIYRAQNFHGDFRLPYPPCNSAISFPYRLQLSVPSFAFIVSSRATFGIEYSFCTLKNFADLNRRNIPLVIYEIMCVNRKNPIFVTLA